LLICLLVVWISGRMVKKEAHADASSSRLSVYSFNVAARIVLSVMIYFSSILAGFLLIALVVIASIYGIPPLFRFLVSSNSFKLIIFGGFFCGLIILSIWWAVLTYAWYLIKPIFTSHKPQDSARVEITRKDAPHLFAIIDELTDEINIDKPAKVYLSSKTNACVSFKTGFWNIFFPSRRDLEIGLGLLYSTNVSELKSVIAHEFGHFAQGQDKIGKSVYMINSIFRDLLSGDDYWEDKLYDWRTSTSGIRSMAASFVEFMISKTRQGMTKVYNSLNQASFSLGRQREYDADAIAAKLSGKKPLISLLCKLEGLQERMSLYEKFVYDAVGSKNKLPRDYWSGYDFFLHHLEEAEKEVISYDKFLEAPFPVLAKSRIDLNDEFDTHPSLDRRINHINSLNTPDVDLSMQPSSNLIDKDFFNRVAEEAMKETVYKANLAWNNIERFSDTELEDYIKMTYDERVYPEEYAVFFNRSFTPFDLRIIDIPQETPPSPFTDENRQFVARYQQALADLQTLRGFQFGNIPKKTFIYNGTLYKQKDAPVGLHLDYIRSMEKSISEIDKEILTFSLSVDTPDNLARNAFDNIYYAQFVIKKIDETFSQNRAEYLSRLNSFSGELPQNVYDELRNRSISMERDIKEFLSRIDFQRAFPVIHSDTFSMFQEFLNSDTAFIHMIDAEGVNRMFIMLDNAVSAMNHLIYYSKRIIIDVLRGKQPLMYWNGSVADPHKKE
ncbi:MAG: M48 family metalloprotease, partial [Muribaculaceae bacterium]|nr:M48 family metalloprotease [Muribaculaceae bacterium]